MMSSIFHFFCVIHNIYCDFDTTAAGGRRQKKQPKTTGTQLSWSQYSWKANRLGDGRTEGGGGLGGRWHSVQRPLAESGSFI